MFSDWSLYFTLLYVIGWLKVNGMLPAMACHVVRCYCVQKEKKIQETYNNKIDIHNCAIYGQNEVCG